MNTNNLSVNGIPGDIWMKKNNLMSLEDFTRYLNIIFEKCGTGLSYPHDPDKHPIFFIRPNQKMFFCEMWFKYFDINPLLFGEANMKLFMNKVVILREVRGMDNVLQFVNRKSKKWPIEGGMLEIKMKRNIEELLRDDELNIDRLSA